MLRGTVTAEAGRTLESICRKQRFVGSFIQQEIANDAFPTRHHLPRPLIPHRHAACQLFHHTSFARSIYTPAEVFAEAWETYHHGYSMSCRHTEKLCGDAEPLRLAANTAGNIPLCPPLPICQSVRRWGLTAGQAGTHPWPPCERLTKQQEPTLWRLRKGHELWGGQNKPSLLNSCQIGDLDISQLAKSRKCC